MADHLGVVVGREERLALAARRHRHEAHEVGEPGEFRLLELGMLVPVMVDVPGLVGDHQIVAAGIDGILEDHEVLDQQLVHAADRLEGMEIVLARFELDVLRFAGQAGGERMDALAVGREQACHGILRQPVDLQAGTELAQFAGDGDVAAPVAEADGRGQIERLLLARGAACLRPGRGPGRGDAQPAIEKVVDQGVALGGIAAERIVAAARDGYELAAGELGDELAAGMELDLVVVAMDRQYRTADLAVHRLGDVEFRQDGPRFHRPGQHRAAGVEGPVETILDLLGRVRLGVDVPDEVLGEVGIVGQPVRAVVLVPAHRLFTAGRACGVMKCWCTMCRWVGPTAPATPARMAALTRAGW